MTNINQFYRYEDIGKGGNITLTILSLSGECIEQKRFDSPAGARMYRVLLYPDAHSQRGHEYGGDCPQCEAALVD